VTTTEHRKLATGTPAVKKYTSIAPRPERFHPHPFMLTQPTENALTRD
jgi:hypothetical protein